MIKQKQIKEKQIPLLCRDPIFKSVFIENPNILGKMISDITGIDYSLIKDNIELIVNDIPLKRKDEKFKRSDFLVRINENNVIILELNTKNSKSGKLKNLSYSFDVFGTHASKGKDYNTKFKLIEINLNYYKDKTKSPLVEYVLLSNDNNHVNYLDNYKIMDLNIYKSHNIYYTKTSSESIPNYIRWGELLYNEDIKRIPKIMEGILTKEESEALMRKTRDLVTKKEYYALSKKWLEWEEKASYYEALDEARKKGLREGRKEGKEIGIKEGLKEGQEEKLSIIKNMINEGIPNEVISKVTGITIDRIIKLNEKDK